MEELQALYEEVKVQNSFKASYCEELELKLQSNEQTTRSISTELEFNKNELKEITEKSKKLEERYTILDMNNKYLTSEKGRLEEELSSACNKLQELVKANTINEQHNKHIIDKLDKAKVIISDKDLMLVKYKKQLEELKGEYAKIERRLNVNENMNKSLEREANITKEALNNKIQILEEQIKVEAKNKGALLSHNDTERKTHLKAEKNLAKLNYELELTKVKLTTAESTVDIKEKEINELKSSNDNLELHLRKTENQKNAMKLECEKYATLIKKLEDNYEIKLELKAQEIKNLDRHYNLLLTRENVINEDLRSRYIELNNNIHNKVFNVLLLRILDYTKVEV